MTISSSLVKSGPYSGNDVTTVFAYGFKIFADSDVRVVIKDENDIETDIVLGVDYTVSGAGNDLGGSITYPVSGSPLASGNKLTILSDIEIEQLTDLSNQGGFFHEVHESSFDKQVRMTQQLKEIVSRKLELPVSSAFSNLSIPDPISGSFLQWKSDLSGLQNVTGMAASAHVVSAFITTLLDDSDNGEALQTLGATQNVSNMATLREIVPNLNRMLFLKYHTFSGDGGHGVFIPVTGAAPGTYVHNGGTVVVSSTGDGSAAWLRVFSGKVNANWFGIFADGVTDWENTNVSTMIILYELSQTFGVFWPSGLYNTAMNFTNKYQNIKMEFADGAEFGGLFHLVSSGTPVFSEPLSNVAIGVNPTITTASAHGMGSERYCSFEGTGTSLDSGNYLVTSTGANTATVTATVTGTYTGPGSLSDISIENVILKGDYVTYDRFGTININGLIADRIICKSDTSKNTLGDEGGGVHIYTMCKNFNVNEVIIEDTKNQAASANMHAAFACDGVGLEGLNFNKVWVKDTKVNGAIIQGEGYHIGQMIIDRYGNGVMSSVIPYVGDQDLHSQTSASRAHGLWISRATGRIDHVVINQKDGFSGRAFADKDVCFDRDFLLWDSPQTTSFIDTKTGFSVGHIECKNPQYVAVDFGSYKGWCTPTVEKITLGIIDDDNDAILSDSSRLLRGLINIGYTRAKIGQIRAQNIKEARLLLNQINYTFSITAAMGRQPSIDVGSIDVEDHGATVIEIHCPHNFCSISFDKITIKSTYYLEPSIVFGTRAKGGHIGRIHARLEAGQINKSLLEYSATSSNIGSIEAYNFVANKASNDAVLHFKNCRYSTVGNINVDASSLSASGGGIKYTGTYNFKTDVALVNNMNHGVVDGGGNGRVICVGCVALTNTTDSDLPVGNLVVNQGNYQWTV